MQGGTDRCGSAGICIDVAEAERCIQVGDTLSEEGNLDGALEQYRLAQRHDPTDFEAWMLEGDILLELSCPAAAATAFENACEADPDDHDLYLRRGRALALCHDYEGALSCAATAVKLLSEAAAPAAAGGEGGQEERSSEDGQPMADALVAQGVAAFNLERLEEAIHLYTEALKVAPLHKHARNNKRHAIARLCWHGASESTPGHGEGAEGGEELLLQPYYSVELPSNANTAQSFERNPLWAAYAMHWLDNAACTMLIAAAERHTAANGGWVSTRHTGPYSTLDFEVSEAPEIRDWIRPKVQTILLRTMASLFLHHAGAAGAGAGTSAGAGAGVGAAAAAAGAGAGGTRLKADLVLRELFVVKYEAASGGDGSSVDRTPTSEDSDGGGSGGATGQDTKQAGLRLHRDGHLLSFSILLSEPHGVDFDGGGTRLETIGLSVCPEHAGDVFMHSGRMLHGGTAVTRGVRYIIVGFVEAIPSGVAYNAAGAQKHAGAGAVNISGGNGRTNGDGEPAHNLNIALVEQQKQQQQQQQQGGLDDYTMLAWEWKALLNAVA